MNIKPYTQLGLSLVELMIALAISSFLILGITQIYIDNKRNFVFHQHQLNNQENTRFAQIMLDTWLSKAGYRRSPDQFIEDAFPQKSATTDCEEFKQGHVVSNFKPANSNESGLCIRYQPSSDTETDCRGDTVKTTGGSNSKLKKPFVHPHKDEIVVVALKFVHGTDFHEGKLMCKNLNGKTPEYVELVDGIADVRFEYASGKNDIFEKKLSDSNPWSNQVSSGMVRAIRYSMLAASSPKQRDGDSAVLNNWVSQYISSAEQQAFIAKDKKNIYQVVTGTHTLRNMMP